MDIAQQNSAFDRLLDQVVECFTPGVAHQIADLRPELSLHARLIELSRKAGEGSLTQAELWEYQSCIEAVDVIGAIRAKAQVMTLAH
jgi:hypothetical protein